MLGNVVNPEQLNAPSERPGGRWGRARQPLGRPPAGLDRRRPALARGAEQDRAAHAMEQGEVAQKVEVLRLALPAAQARVDDQPPAVDPGRGTGLGPDGEMVEHLERATAVAG